MGLPLSCNFGAWRRPVARLHGVQEVECSNHFAPTWPEPYLRFSVFVLLRFRPRTAVALTMRCRSLFVLPGPAIIHRLFLLAILLHTLYFLTTK